MEALQVSVSQLGISCAEKSKTYHVLGHSTSTNTASVLQIVISLC